MVFVQTFVDGQRRATVPHPPTTGIENAEVSLDAETIVQQLFSK
jgi:hypothetical protein